MVRHWDGFRIAFNSDDPIGVWSMVRKLSIQNGQATEAPDLLFLGKPKDPCGVLWPKFVVVFVFGALCIGAIGWWMR